MTCCVCMCRCENADACRAWVRPHLQEGLWLTTLHFWCLAPSYSLSLDAVLNEVNSHSFSVLMKILSRLQRGAPPFPPLKVPSCLTLHILYCLWPMLSPKPRAQSWTWELLIIIHYLKGTVPASASAVFPKAVIMLHFLPYSSQFLSLSHLESGSLKISFGMCGCLWNCGSCSLDSFSPTDGWSWGSECYHSDQVIVSAKWEIPLKSWVPRPWHNTDLHFLECGHFRDCP